MFLLLTTISKFKGYKVTWDHDMEIDMDEINSEEYSGTRPALTQWLLIYPGKFSYN